MTKSPIHEPDNKLGESNDDSGQIPSLINKGASDNQPSKSVEETNDLKKNPQPKYIAHLADENLDMEEPTDESDQESSETNGSEVIDLSSDEEVIIDETD
ncbi:hypothetical protein GCK72_026017 [Caenorhabditis remanei]|uniref:Uncharacterized protein n=1 Tax=Caenorhabditis remanei TaxID=31234 RepID=E3MP62_CAERE|nr:hypothetical protein GCK72_026013 [Caenorhabditis remanei]XP_053580178.1 hypothetical protein GCK72_026017 [Caenorhabditis remanei]EFP06402.1 hypothetical protein CRE_07593 [Caenorhabditis remanei]KAF1749545.1 hypothetical protein GCK72_026013 [Caenorhabditis remanei]KAF1749549.1 hypothetical protein GCK72_026017 [Caenorhabditis remanei]